MNTDTGYLRKIEPEKALTDREVAALLKEREGQLAALRAREILVPADQEEAVVNMTRQQRRAWARQQAKAHR